MAAAANLPMTGVRDNPNATLDLTAKWEGLSGNDIEVEITGSVPGLTFAITQPSGGLVSPDVNVALNQVGNVWETMVLNCTDMATATLDAYSTFGEGRWGRTRP